MQRRMTERGTAQCACAADMRLMCGRLVPGAHLMPLLDALKRACRRSSLHRRAGALEVRYRGAAGGAEKAHTRQRRWCLWSKGNR
jgi:hypothetical protein